MEMPRKKNTGIVVDVQYDCLGLPLSFASGPTTKKRHNKQAFIAPPKAMEEEVVVEEVDNLVDEDFTADPMDFKNEVVTTALQNTTLYEIKERTVQVPKPAAKTSETRESAGKTTNEKAPSEAAKPAKEKEEEEEGEIAETEEGEVIEEDKKEDSDEEDNVPTFSMGMFLQLMSGQQPQKEKNEPPPPPPKDLEEGEIFEKPKVKKKLPLPVFPKEEEITEKRQIVIRKSKAPSKLTASIAKDFDTSDHFSFSESAPIQSFDPAQGIDAPMGVKDFIEPQDNAFLEEQEPDRRVVTVKPKTGRELPTVKSSSESKTSSVNMDIGVDPKQTQADNAGGLSKEVRNEARSASNMAPRFW